MTKTIRNLLSICAFTITSLAVPQASADDIMFKLFIEAHDFNEYQQELALELVESGRALAAEIKKPKEELKGHVTALIEKDQLDVETMMQSYQSWQSGVDEKLLAVLQSLARLHAQLTEEQREALVQTLHKMRGK